MKAAGCLETSVSAKLHIATPHKTVFIVAATRNLKSSQQMATCHRRLHWTRLTLDFFGFSTKFGIRFHFVLFFFAKKC
jgi:hypothetical protein